MSGVGDHDRRLRPTDLPFFSQTHLGLNKPLAYCVRSCLLGEKKTLYLAVVSCNKFIKGPCLLTGIKTPVFRGTSVDFVLLTSSPCA